MMFRPEETLDGHGHQRLPDRLSGVTACKQATVIKACQGGLFIQGPGLKRGRNHQSQKGKFWRSSADLWATLKIDRDHAFGRNSRQKTLATGGCKVKDRDVEIYADDSGACSRGGKGLLPPAVRQEGALTNSLKTMGLITQHWRVSSRCSARENTVNVVFKVAVCRIFVFSIWTSNWRKCFFDFFTLK